MKHILTYLLLHDTSKCYFWLELHAWHKAEWHYIFLCLNAHAKQWIMHPVPHPPIQGRTGYDVGPRDKLCTGPPPPIVSWKGLPSRRPPSLFPGDPINNIWWTFEKQTKLDVDCVDWFICIAGCNQINTGLYILNKNIISCIRHWQQPIMRPILADICYLKSFQSYWYND